MTKRLLTLPYLILLALTFALTGCKLDDAGFTENSINKDGSVATSGPIVGMWFLKTETSVGTALGIPINETQAGTTKDYYLFKADHTVDVSSADDGISSGTYTYDAASKKLTMKKDNETSEFVLNKLTADEMVLYITVSVPALGTSLNVTATYTH